MDSETTSDMSCLLMKKVEYKRANWYEFGSFEVSKNEIMSYFLLFTTEDC
jgi:hypothetical protein